jgi:tight adherence protein C
VASAVVAFGLMFYFVHSRGEQRSRSDIRKRLDINAPQKKKDEPAPAAAKGGARDTARKIAERANDFYANSDPVNQRRIRTQLMQAGYMHPGALGYFLAARFGLGIGGALVGTIVMFFVFSDWPIAKQLTGVLLGATLGYFLPNFHLSSRAKKLQQENRAGFPDVMDLMIVAAEAGLTMEASIERIAKEIQRTYPTLSRQLTLAAIEIRAGRPLDQALRAFGERLGLDEVQGFATMIQQSKELGTSIADALRVYSEEMRHKRMMMAEEKAYALPAKLSIPVTAFILPIVIGIAVLPTAIRLMHQ